jgi:hypothetical protein
MIISVTFSADRASVRAVCLHVDASKRLAPIQTASTTVAGWRHGDALRTRQVSMMLASTPNARVPSVDQLSRLIRREMTQCRSDGSGELFVNGRCGLRI